MKERKILVTGGAGYIGSHTVVELQEAGYTPIIVDNLINSDADAIAQIGKITGQLPLFYPMDLCVMENVRKLVAEHPDIEGIIHFAALKAVGESVEQPVMYYRNNFLSLLHLLEGFSDKSVNLVFSSSCTVYGQPDHLPVSENDPVKKAESPYGNTKQVAEEMLQDWVRTQDQSKVTSLRYFNPVGAHETALIGELPLGIPQNLVPYITQSAIGKRGPITVFGKDYDTPDGTAIRDYIHVVDLAKAHVAALKYMERDQSGDRYDVFNVGTGRGYSVLDVILAFQEATGVDLKYQFGPRRAGDIMQVWGDVRKSAEKLNWRATRDMTAMMKSAWAWELYLKDKK